VIRLISVALLMATVACDDTVFGVPSHGSGGGTAGSSGSTDSGATQSDSGATQSDSGGTGSSSYHPEGFSDPTIHGMQAKLQEQVCVACHGDTLEGAGQALSCDTCHPTGWRTTCTFCHGGAVDTTGSPPGHLSNTDETDTHAFGPHMSHVAAGELHDGFDCDSCHVKPTDVLSVGHLFVGDESPGVADVDFSGGLSPSASWTGTSCSDLYCHGDGRRNNGSMSGQGEVTGCGDCHADLDGGRDAWDTMSGEHEDHLREGLECADCHGETTSDSRSIADVSLHVNGTVDLSWTGSVVKTGDTCNGACHGEDHDDRDWD